METVLVDISLSLCLWDVSITGTCKSFFWFKHFKKLESLFEVLLYVIKMVTSYRKSCHLIPKFYFELTPGLTIFLPDSNGQHWKYGSSRWDKKKSWNYSFLRGHFQRITKTISIPVTQSSVLQKPLTWVEITKCPMHSEHSTNMWFMLLLTYLYPVFSSFHFSNGWTYNINPIPGQLLLTFWVLLLVNSLSCFAKFCSPEKGQRYKLGALKTRRIGTYNLLILYNWFHF